MRHERSGGKSTLDDVWVARTRVLFCSLLISVDSPILSKSSAHQRWSSFCKGSIEVLQRRFWSCLNLNPQFPEVSYMKASGANSFRNNKMPSEGVLPNRNRCLSCHFRNDDITLQELSGPRQSHAFYDNAGGRPSVYHFGQKSLFELKRRLDILNQCVMEEGRPPEDIIECMRLKLEGPDEFLEEVISSFQEEDNGRTSICFLFGKTPPRGIFCCFERIGLRRAHIWTLQETADVMSLTRERVRQLQNRSLRNTSNRAAKKTYFRIGKKPWFGLPQHHLLVSRVSLRGSSPRV